MVDSFHFTTEGLIMALGCRKYGMKQSLTVEDIRGVRLELPAETGKENSSRAANRNNSAAHPSPSPELTPAKAAKGRRLLRQLTRR